jgi:hypoxanthine-DNA glycosylase
MHSTGFPPISRSDARVLILGTLPSQASLQRRQYYGLPQNGFWRIMGRLLGFSHELPYAQRKRQLVQNRIALWDVCASAVRPGSLDASIRDVVPNDFARFFLNHRSIEVVCFNGATARKLYHRLVLPGLAETLPALRYEALPSTSPAHAGMPFDEKLRRWAIVQKKCRDASRAVVRCEDL